MKFNFLLICLLFWPTISSAQIQASNWYFGSNAGLSFSTNPPTPVTGSLNTYEGCSAISDLTGNLLFYTDGVTVWNKLHAIMANGTGLQGHTSSSQSALILPRPGSNTLYYIITAPENSSFNPLAYSVVDMSLNSGIGGVTLKNISLLSNSTEKVTAVSHQNGTDIWIISHTFLNSNFHAFLLTPTGINANAIISTTGNAITINEHRIGILKASPCGTHVAMSNHGLDGLIPSTLELFDFNNATGMLSNATLLSSSLNSAFGTEFSPNNQMLYRTYTDPGFIVQYDLTAGSSAAIIASADTIGQTSHFTGAMQTGPDGRIYVTKYTKQSLACITSPNLPGISSGFVDNFITLPDSCLLGLPGFLTSWFCNIPSGVAVSEWTEALVYPNPFSDQFTISGIEVQNEPESILLYDLLGHQVLDEHMITRNNDHIEINPGPLSDGIYMLEVKTVESGFRMKIVKNQP